MPLKQQFNQTSALTEHVILYRCSVSTWFACALITCLMTGCATPDYLLPGGYSSTYHKAITNQQAAAFSPSMNPSSYPAQQPMLPPGTGPGTVHWSK